MKISGSIISNLPAENLQSLFLKAKDTYFNNTSLSYLQSFGFNESEINEIKVDLDGVFFEEMDTFIDDCRESKLTLKDIEFFVDDFFNSFCVERVDECIDKWVDYPESKEAWDIYNEIYSEDITPSTGWDYLAETVEKLSDYAVSIRFFINKDYLLLRIL